MLCPGHSIAVAVSRTVRTQQWCCNSLLLLLFQSLSLHNPIPPSPTSAPQSAGSSLTHFPLSASLPYPSLVPSSVPSLLTCLSKYKSIRHRREQRQIWGLTAQVHFTACT